MFKLFACIFSLFLFSNLFVILINYHIYIIYLIISLIFSLSLYHIRYKRNRIKLNIYLYIFIFIYLFWSIIIWKLFSSYLIILYINMCFI